MPSIQLDGIDLFMFETKRRLTKIVDMKFWLVFPYLIIMFAVPSDKNNRPGDDGTFQSV